MRVRGSEATVASRRIVLVIAAALSAACGLGVVGGVGGGGEDENDAREGGAETAAQGQPDGSGVDTQAGESDGPELDAGLDVSPANCLALCDGGTCDGGWCVLSCSATGGCSGRVTCPPGIPCSVDCSGVGACKDGVDCANATACSVSCAGTGACTGAMDCSNAGACSLKCSGTGSCSSVACSGTQCDVECAGLSTCAGGVRCDAGDCKIGCSGTSSCVGGASCNAGGCTIACDGEPSINGAPTCDEGARCTATNDCRIDCTERRTCSGAQVVANAGATAQVRCDGTNACAKGVAIRAPDSGVSCQGSGACGGTEDGIHCDGGRCRVTCDKSDDVRFCCSAASCSSEKGSSCDFTTSDCDD